MKKILLLSAGLLVLFAACKKEPPVNPPEPPEPPVPNVTTTLTAVGLENTGVTLIATSGEEFDLTLDGKGEATLATPADVVFTRLVVETNEVLIGRIAGGKISFIYEEGDVVFGAATDGVIPIGIVEELVHIGEEKANWTKSYLQQADLDLVGIDWTPLCRPGRELLRYADLDGDGIEETPQYGHTYDNYFKGSYDGGGHKIHNLTIDRPEEYYLALFGQVGHLQDNGGAVSNLTIASGSISGAGYLATIAGRICGGEITDCANYATVNGGGGLVSQLLSFSTIEDCANYGDILSGGAGVVESSVASIIRNCENHGLVKGGGGVAGIISSANGTNIDGCTNYGTIEASGSGAAGIAADVGGSFGIVENCINAGTVRVGTYNGGGIVGSQSDGVIENCENRGVIEYIGEPQDHTAGIGGIVGSTQQGGEITGCTNSAEAEFRNMYSRVGGIAGFVNEATVMDCVNYGDISVAYAVAGGIAGENRGNIANCENHGNISGQSRIGGIVGDNYTGRNVARIRFCLNTGEISGNSFSGGIAGINYAICSGCINRGAVKGTDPGEALGGINGGLAGPAGYVLACYNTGSVEGTKKIGGVVGSANSNALIEASYSVGTVSGNSDVAAICGFFEDDQSKVVNCYWSNYNGKGVSVGRGSASYFDDGTTPTAGATTGWPETSMANWGTGDGTNGNWWKNLGTRGSADYPELFWEE